VEEDLVGGMKVSAPGAKLEEMVWHFLGWRREEDQSGRDGSD
jgi:hypothetical protein